MVWDRLLGEQGDEQRLAVNPNGVLFRGPLSPLEQRQDLSGIMDRDDTPGRGFIEFTANYTVWPFNENITADRLLGEFDEEYLRLAEELAILGFRFRLSQWWSR